MFTRKRNLAIIGFVSAACIGLVVFVLTRNPSSPYSYHPTSERIQDALESTKTQSYLEDIIPRVVRFDNEQQKQLPPKFSIKNYLMQAALPKTPKNVHLYTFKTHFAQTEVENLARRVLGDQFEITENPQDRTLIAIAPAGSLTFDMLTGGFTLHSLSTAFTQPTSSDPDSMIPAVTRYLRDDLGVIDDTVKATAYYTKNNIDSTVYFEFHRADVDLPILNPFAIIALRDDQKIDELTYAHFGQDDPDDPSITSASDVSGKARRDDFNTLTLGLTHIEENGQWLVTSIDSNLRPLESTSSVEQKQLALLPSSDVIAQLKDGSYFNLTLPSGTGAIDLDKVYPDNVLHSENATVTDIALAYFEKPGFALQSYLQPAYIVKGYTETDTGIRVAFSRVVPAVEDPDAIAHRARPLYARIINRVFSGLLPVSVAQTSMSAGETSICDKSGQAYWCTFETFKIPPTPIPPVPTSTPAPTLPPVPVTSAPTRPPEPTLIPSPPPDVNTPCILYDAKGSIIEYAYEFTSPELTYEFLSPQEASSYYIESIRVAYFRNLPNGPIFFRKILSGDASKASLNQLLRRNDSFQRTLDIELNIRAAKVLVVRPELRANAFIDVNTLGFDGVVTRHDVVDLNAIFPEVPLNIQLHARRIEVLFGEHLYKAVHETGGYTIESLATQQQPLSNMPLAALLYTRLGFNDAPILTYPGNDLSGYRFDARCAILSPQSPSIYVYPPQTSDVHLTLDHTHYTYTDPYLPPEGIRFAAHPDGALDFNGSTRERMYYEYAQVTFKRPHAGWTVKTADLTSFIRKHIAQPLNLTERETDDLILDVIASMHGREDRQYIFVGLLPEHDVHEALPMTVNPTPDTIRRIHVYLEPTDSILKKTAPRLTPIERKGFTVIETGVYVQ